MAGPLQPIPGYDPSANGGSLHPLLHILGIGARNIGSGLARDAVSLPGQVGAMLDPRNPANLVNLAGILVPGDRMGGPTIPQQEFLNAIRSSSAGRAERMAAQTGVLRRPIFEPGDPLVQALAQHIGGTANMRTDSPDFPVQAANPWAGLTNGGTMFNPTARLGIQQHGDGGTAAQGFHAIMRSGDLASHQGWVLQQIARNAIQRRN